MKHQQTNHRKTFNKLKKQTHLLKWKQDQIDSEIHQVWVQEKKRLTSNIACLRNDDWLVVWDV